MRINVVHPKYLTDQHLIAEGREIKMLPKMFIKSLRSKGGLGNFGGLYTLNKGHGKCLYDKFGFIQSRFEDLVTEIKSRGFKMSYDILDLSQIPQEFFGDYKPTPEALRINVERIKLRIHDKPSWYRYRGHRMDWDKFYERFN